ncbi:hypothetical protein BTUL_0002g01280 [Botrytis tulipae]|uniref:Uncharacterized protein n=1 Tax=Botrytis tulipae TaxID=87230 RepID=A0A4Z1FER5_9HELO|nr:hypothetical protein BTUL_0002g01280 [Botrytis tulipae]
MPLVKFQADILLRCSKIVHEVGEDQTNKSEEEEIKEMERTDNDNRNWNILSHVPDDGKSTRET